MMLILLIVIVVSACFFTAQLRHFWGVLRRSGEAGFLPVAPGEPEEPPPVGGELPAAEKARKRRRWSCCPGVSARHTHTAHFARDEYQSDRVGRATAVAGPCEMNPVLDKIEALQPDGGARGYHHLACGARRVTTRWAGCPGPSTNARRGGPVLPGSAWRWATRPDGSDVGHERAALLRERAHSWEIEGRKMVTVRALT